ncbi:DEAD/DEAH box helicase [Telmatocola sphagniphila]|uniref:DEAD/DEAH box helicase n=2 Tax=Telmatocola sphagniphila TaxID=1123043 RepID=A0A8E6BAL1_9BACT|nr:DEAD/DEAH box helicase [Telmatocola sphagniphila]
MPEGEAGSGFQPLNLIRPLLDAVAFAGYVNPSPIQSALIPVAITGKDVIGQSQTGTGKTAAFLIPFMNSWRGNDPRFPQALVMTPTRELAVQVAGEATKLSPSRHFRTVCCYGGQKFGLQMDQLRKGITLLVGTPGRIFDHLSRGTISLDHVRYVVLDEADQMLDIGFRPQIERIMRKLPKKRQTLLLSATMPPPVMKLVQRYLVEPEHINITPETPTVDKITQKYFTVDEHNKFDLLLKVLDREKPRQCIIFVERKRSADRLYKDLQKHLPGVNVTHGDLEQKKRERIMADFRSAKITTLIATNVMSRGIDVKGISHIINYDLPQDLESYVHRIGRTGRMGRDGKAISFVTPEQGSMLTGIELMINRLIEEDHFEDFEAWTPRATTEAEAPKASKPVFGRSNKKYSNRL